MPPPMISPRFWKPRFAPARSVRLFLTRWCTEASEKMRLTCRTVTLCSSRQTRTTRYRVSASKTQATASSTFERSQACNLTASSTAGITTGGKGGTTTIGLKQDRKYPPGITVQNNPDLQKWKFTSSTISRNLSGGLHICVAAPGKVLQPAWRQHRVRSSRRARGVPAAHLPIAISSGAMALLLPPSGLTHL